MKDLAKAMGRKWCDHKWVKRCDSTYFCSQPGCWYSENSAAFYETELPRNPTFSAPSELGPLILWAVKQEWWEDFDDIATEVWWPEGQSPRGDYLAWLFQSTEHFAKLLAAYLRKGE